MRLLFSVGAKDFDMQVFRAGGKGGQKQNKTSSGVRLIHRASGARGESREHRHQWANKRAAFLRLLKTKEWIIWHKQEIARHLGQEAEAEKSVQEMMRAGNLKVEYRTGRGWEVEDAERREG